MTLNFFEFHRSMDGVEDLYYHEIGQYGLKYAYLEEEVYACLLYTSPSPRDRQKSRMPSSA